MGIGRILLSPQYFFHTPNLLQLPLNHPPCCPPTHVHLHTGPRGCFVHRWNVWVELCVRPPPNPHHAHHAKTQSPCICTLALEAPDRKSTRLNSSHANISYAVFCLKKKNIICHTIKQH